MVASSTGGRVRQRPLGATDLKFVSGDDDPMVTAGLRDRLDEQDRKRADRVAIRDAARRADPGKVAILAKLNSVLGLPNMDLPRHSIGYPGKMSAAGFSNIGMVVDHLIRTIEEYGDPIPVLTMLTIGFADPTICEVMARHGGERFVYNEPDLNSILMDTQTVMMKEGYKLCESVVFFVAQRCTEYNVPYGPDGPTNIDIDIVAQFAPRRSRQQRMLRSGLPFDGIKFMIDKKVDPAGPMFELLMRLCDIYATDTSIDADLHIYAAEQGVQASVRWLFAHRWFKDLVYVIGTDALVKMGDSVLRAAIDTKKFNAMRDVAHIAVECPGSRVLREEFVYDYIMSIGYDFVGGFSQLKLSLTTVCMVKNFKELLHKNPAMYYGRSYGELTAGQQLPDDVNKRRAAFIFVFLELGRGDILSELAAFDRTLQFGVLTLDYVCGVRSLSRDATGLYGRVFTADYQAVMRGEFEPVL